MLIYHQHHDIYHCILRLLSITSILEGKEIEYSKLRIIDFYLVFPHLISDVILPQGKGMAKFKNYAKGFPLPYEILPEKKRLFSEMGDFQIQAFHILKAKQILKENESGEILTDAMFNDEKIKNLILKSRFINEEFYVNLINILNDIPLLGSNGLKKRTALMEYRYDDV